MKILITTDWYYPVVNGVVMSVLTLCKELRKRGREVKILTLSGTCRSHEENDVIYMASVGAGCVYPQARLRIPTPAPCREELLEWKPDIIHSQCEFSTFSPGEKQSGRNISLILRQRCFCMWEGWQRRKT